MSARLALDYFDGRIARAQPAEIWLAEGQLHLATAADVKRYAAQAVRWPERQRHGQRQALLPDGGVLVCADAGAWDDWACASGLRDSLTVRWMQSWQHSLGAVLLTVLLLAAGWFWGVPAATRGLVALMPPGLEQQIGEQALQYVDGRWIKPSKLSAAQQEELAQRFAQAAATAALKTGPQPAYRLHFRSGGKWLGPNAFALPGGDIVVTDELVGLLADEPNALIGVLGHELGHVRGQHGLRNLVQSGVVAVVTSVIIGDFSSVLAGAPVLLAQSSYSRGFEREADDYARRLMRAAGIPPSSMVVFFERIAEKRKEMKAEPPPITISSHPADEERMRFFRGE